MDFLTFRGDGLLRYLQRGFGIFDAALRILSAHHDFQLAVFGFGDFGLGIGDFVLQRLVSFRSASWIRLGKDSSSARKAAMCRSTVCSSRRRGIAGCMQLKFSTA